MSSELKQLNRSLLRSLMSTGTANLVSDRLEELERDLTRAHEDKRALREALEKLVPQAERMTEIATTERGDGPTESFLAWAAINQSHYVLRLIDASPESAKNTEGEK